MYLFVSRLYDSSFATYHSSHEDLAREVLLIEEEHQHADPGFKLNFIDPRALDQECGLAAYPHGTAIVVNFINSLDGTSLPGSKPKPTIEWPTPELASDSMEQGIYVGDVESETYVSPFSGKQV
jgi:hypothetical protein